MSTLRFSCVLCHNWSYDVADDNHDRDADDMMDRFKDHVAKHPAPQLAAYLLEMEPV